MRGCGENVGPLLPIARIKRLVQLDPAVGIVSKESVALIAKAAVFCS